VNLITMAGRLGSEAVLKSLPSLLGSLKGVEALVEYIRAALQQETPIRVTETFELVFYDPERV
jgi:hypothetical protein